MSKFNRWLAILLCLLMLDTSALGDFSLAIAEAQEEPQIVVQAAEENTAEPEAPEPVAAAEPVAEKATEAPVVTEAPAATDAPVVTEAPAAPDAPEVTEAPAATDVPEVTEAPAATDVPEVTEAPATTDVPEVTEVPAATDAPVVTEAPVATDVPNPIDYEKDASKSPEFEFGYAEVLEDASLYEADDEKAEVFAEMGKGAVVLAVKRETNARVDRLKVTFAYEEKEASAWVEASAIRPMDEKEVEAFKDGIQTPKNETVFYKDDAEYPLSEPSIELKKVEEPTQAPTAQVTEAPEADATETPDESQIAAPVLTLALSEAEIPVGESLTVEPVFADGEDRALNYISNAPEAAQVSEDGVVSALSEGSAQIVVECAELGESAVLTVDVVELAEENLLGTTVQIAPTLTMEPSELKLAVGMESAVKATLTPASDAQVTYQSSDEKIATVDANGLVTAVAAGSCEIVAKSGELTASTALTVYIPDVALNAYAVELTVTETFQLAATVNKQEETLEGAAWSTADPLVATVDANGLVTAVGSGRTTIALTLASSAKVECAISVRLQPDKIVIDAGTINVIKGRIIELPVSFERTDGQQCATVYSLKTSNKKYVAVNGTQIKGVKAGSATITVSTYNGVTAKVKVTVWEKPTKVALDVKSVTVGEETSQSVRAKVYYKKKSFVYSAADAAGVGTFTTGNSAIATVDASGKVTGVAKGETYVRFTTLNGKSAQIPVTVLGKPTQIKLDKTSATLGAGDTLKLTASFGEYEMGDVTYTSADPSVAKVASDGTITAVAKGETTILATVNGHDASCAVKVVPAPAKVTIEESAINVIKGRTMELPVTVTNTDGDVCDATISLKTSNKKYVAVNGTQIKGVKAGSATITVSTYNGVTAKVKVTVWEKPTKVALDVKSVTVGEETSQSVRAKVYYKKKSFVYSAADAAGVGTFTTGNSAIATVDASGKVTGVAKGETYVRFTTLNGKSAQIPVYVKSAPTQLNLDKEELSLGVLMTYTLNATFGKDEIGTTTFETSDAAVASVDATGKITAKGEGTAFITAQTVSKSGETLSKVCTVRVTAAPDKIALNMTSSNVAIKGKVQLSAVCTYKGETGCEATLTYASSNKKVATVDANGVIKGVKAGSATIRVTAQNGVYADCKVTVRKAPTKVALSSSSYSMGVGQTFTLQARVYYSGGNFLFGKNDSSMAVFESSNPNVATIDASGKVTAIAEGTTNLRLRTYNGKGAKTYCKVTVTSGPDWMAFTQVETAISVGQTTTLYCDRSTGSQTSMTYAAADPSVLSVRSSDAYCVIEALKPGETTVTATASNGTKASTRVVVYAAPKSVEFAKTQISMGAGEGAALPSIEVKADDGTCLQSVSYASSNEDVAYVTDAGYVKAIKAGTATITASTYNGKRATCVVNVQQAPKQVTVSAEKAQIAVGETVKLTVKLDTVGACTFTVSDETILSVNASGTVTALKPGTAEVFATAYNGVKGSCKLTVQEKPESVKLSDDELTLGVGMTATLTASIPKDTLGSFAFFSSDEAVATVDVSGKVTAKAPGSAVIAVSIVDSESVFDTCEVTVKAAPSKITLSSASLNMKTGATAKLSAALDADAYGSVIFVSSDESIAKVSQTGVVTALKAGTATITAKSSANESVKATCKVTVADAKVRLNVEVLTLGVGETFQAEIVKNGSEAISVSSSNEGVATLSADGRITAKAKGEATVKVVCGGETAQCVVKVLNKPASVSIAAKEKTLTVGKTFSLKAALPEGTASTLSYRSSNGKIATVSEEGVVTAVSVGTANITVSTYDSAVSAVCTVTVVGEPERIRFAELTDILVAEGDRYVLNDPVMSSASGACDAAYTLSISNLSCASISKENGRYVIQAKKAGTATLRLKTANGKTATCGLIVVQKPDSMEFDSESAQMGLGESWTPIVTGSNGAVVSCKLTSSNASVVRVEEDGRLVAASKGTATITAKATGFAGLTATMKVTVVDPVKTLKLNLASYCMGLGESRRLTATAENGVAANVVYTSSNEAVVSVDARGRILAVGIGKATVTATAYGGASAKCEIEVRPKATALKLSPRDLNACLSDRVQLTRTYGSDGEYANVVYHSSDSSVVEVSESGLLTFKKLGTAVITAETYDGLSDEITVTVCEQPGSVRFAAETATILNGDRAKLEVLFDKGAGYYELKNSDSSVLSIDADGWIQAKKAGTATVTLTMAALPNLKATCTVKVVDKLEGVAVVAQKDTLQLGEQTELTYQLLPGDVIGSGNIRLESANPEVATVDSETGMVTGVAYGSAVIRAIASDGSVGTCTVNVLGGKRRALVAYWFGETGDDGYLPFARNNGTSVAEAFASATVEGQRYDVAGPMSNTSKSKLFATIDSHFADATDDDVSVIYFCAHGSPGYDSEYMFVSPEAVKSKNRTYYFYANEIMDHILKIKGKVILIMDSCHSGGLIDCTRSRLDAEGGRIAVLCSSHRSTRSSYYSVTNKTQSVDFYTYALLDGLGYNESAGLAGRAHGFYTSDEPADENDDGVVTVQEMFNYADWKTISLVKGMYAAKTFVGSKDQDPQSYIGSKCANTVIFGR